MPGVGTVVAGDVGAGTLDRDSPASTATALIRNVRDQDIRVPDQPPPPPPGAGRPETTGPPVGGAERMPSPAPPDQPPPSTQPDPGRLDGVVDETTPTGAGDVEASPEAVVPLDDRERSLDPRMVIVWRVFGGIGLAFPLIAFGVAGYFLLAATPWTVAGIAAVVWLVGVVWYPRARYRAWHWRLTDIALELRYGVLVHRHEAVPYFRVQQIDISQGPFDRLLGLATLQVTTASASGSAGLPGIPAADAPQIRAQLLARAAAAVGDQPDEVRDAV